MEQRPYTHILQKKGILKAFTVAKVVKTKDIEELKSLIKDVAESDDEYKTLLHEEMKKISDMHDSNNPIPGIIYSAENLARKNLVYGLSQKMIEIINAQNFSKKDMAFLITVIITKLGLSQEDFIKLSEEINNREDDDDEEDEEEED